MQKRLRQISDTIHQTVYSSELESNMMSTAYFYRLHDVYQSSTVYLTFPSNRTKRYEHSHGTMGLAGEMFFSAITNADVSVLNSFFSSAEKHLNTIVTKLLQGNIRPTYCASSQAALANCFSAVLGRALATEANKAISNAYKNFEMIEDVALNHYMPPFSNKLSSTDELNKRKFLYQCLLEAVRIVALFHDVGHPPYSHIMEGTLNDLYNYCKKAPNPTARMSELINNLNPFKGVEYDDITCLLSKPLKVSPEFHEQVGLKMLASAFEDIFQNKFNNLSVEKISKAQKGTTAVYYITVAEFCFAILREQSSFFISLHRIVDGCVDADRMDYIMRDTLNSAVNWGEIPYKRILESCMLIERKFKKDVYYQIAYPSKMVEHIDDLLITRYKIFSRINYHHRSYKTSLILQRLVQILAKDYLEKDDSKRALCPGIADLWNCLSSTLNSGDLYIIQWNDSTLISHLYQTLAEVKSGDCSDYNLSEEQYEDVTSLLEEFLLNRKHFYSVFKRQSDLTPIFSKLFELLAPSVDKVREYEQDKLEKAENSGNSAEQDAEDSLKRLNAEQLDGIIKSGDADSLERIFPLDMLKILSDILEEYKEQGKILSYLVDKNRKRSKTGLPYREDGSDRIYLYNYNTNGHDIELYDVSTLETRLAQLQHYCLQYIAYVEPRSENESITVINEIRQAISTRLFADVKSCMQNLFSCLRT